MSTTGQTCIGFPTSKTRSMTKLRHSNKLTQSREDSKRHLETILALKEGLIAWTQRVVGQSENDIDRRVALDLLAWQIEPAGFAPAERERLTSD